MLNALSTNCNIVMALMKRETLTRFGKNKLGYLWALLEPLVYISVFLAIRSFISQTIPFGDNIIMFVLSGILCFRTFTSIASRGLNSVSSNSALLTYPMVKPMDTIMSRVILEIMTMMVIFMVFFSFMYFITSNHVINHIDIFFEAILALLYLSISFAVFNGVINAIYPTWERIFGLIKLPLLLMSGVFYMPSMLPEQYHQYLMLNPLLNCIEWLRSGIYLDYQPMLNKSYVIWISTFLLSISLVTERVFRRKVMQA